MLGPLSETTSQNKVKKAGGVCCSGLWVHPQYYAHAGEQLFLPGLPLFGRQPQGKQEATRPARPGALTATAQRKTDPGGILTTLLPDHARATQLGWPWA